MPTTKLPTYDSIAQMDQAQAQAALDQLQAAKAPLSQQAEELREQVRKMEDRIRQLHNHLTRLTIPYLPGDIVEDEKGVQYRVTGGKVTKNRNGYGVLQEGDYEVSGIRLNKNGTEAYANPRPIWSKKLHKVAQ